MSTFQSVCEFYRNASYTQPLLQRDQNNHLQINWPYVIYVVSLLEASSTALAFLLFKAHSIVEHADSFYLFSTGITCVIIISLSMWQISNIFQLIAKIDRFIVKSELNLQKK